MRAHVCPWWLAFALDNPLRRIAHRPEALLRPHVRPGSTVLDVGCGTGFFTLALARLVGAGGRVLAVDLQPRMLQIVRRRAERARLAARIETHRCAPDDLQVTTRVDFALAFWMVHEVPDGARLLRQLGALLAPAGRLLVAEPFVHVSRRAFDTTVQRARDAGFTVVGRPRIALGRAVLLASAGAESARPA